MIPVPMGTKIWVACGAVDMRKGLDGLAMLAEEVVNKIRTPGISLHSAASEPIESKSCGGMERACVSTPRGWNVVDLFGR